MSTLQVSTLQEIERAIDRLAPQQIEQLYEWLDEHHPLSIDDRILADFEAGRLDAAIARAVEDERAGRVTPL